ncbi:required for excision 1-B domain-containing protein-like [Mercenaria mercenaria]|uniref:required for excision 1-B domain-containing protein-like n=1 Tax=Mercenaria mercenaria TaxID=6596 RepID=UPI00234EF22C|nr:required for excision 1-B domain-containing protein-like [Mercenaria mercenaria]
MGELRSAEASNSSSGSNAADDTPKQMLSRFYALQEERVQTYKMFEEGFLAYLQGAPNYNFPLYRQLVHEITETFNKISADILHIKSTFAEWNNLLPISEIIGKIQDAEKNKLELTAKLQLCRQKLQDENSETVQIESDEIKQQLKDNRDFLVEQMEELKFESEDLYLEDNEPETVDSTLSAER